MTQPDRSRISGSSVIGSLLAAMLALALAVVPGLVAYGFLQARVASVESHVERLERHEESGQLADQDMLQRIARIEAKIDAIYEWLRRDRKAEVTGP